MCFVWMNPEEIISIGDYVIVADILECYPGKFDGCADKNCFGWVLTMIPAEKNSCKWPDEECRGCHHMGKIELACDPHKAVDNYFSQPCKL